MVDDARLALGPRGLAVCTGPRRTAWCRAEVLTPTAHSRVSGNPEQKYCAGSPLTRERTATLGAAEVLGWIDRSRAFSNLEMQLRRRHIAGLSCVGNYLPALDRVPALDHQLARVRIGGHVTIRMAD